MLLRHLGSYIFLITFLSCVKVFAAFSNYNSILIGDQAAGMGGAYTAWYGDTAAAAYYNPAALAMIKGSSFSIAVSVYKKFDTVIGEEIDFTKAPLRVNQGFFESVPSATGNVIKLLDYTCAFSIVVPDYETYKGDISTTTTDTSTLNYNDESLWVGGAISNALDKTSSWGLSLYYTSRNYTRSVQNRTENAGGTEITIFSEEKTIKGNAIVAILGYHKKFFKELTMGVSLRAPSVKIAGEGSYFRSDITAGTGLTENSPSISETTVASTTHIPPKLTLGFAWNERKWLFTADGSIYGQIRYKDFESDDDFSSTVEHVVSYNGALGVEYRWKKWIHFRMGWFTDLTSQRELDPDDKVGDRVDKLGYAANLAIFRDDHVSFTFGGYWTGGRGKTVQRMEQMYQVVPKTQQTFTMLVGSSFYF